MNSAMYLKFTDSDNGWQSLITICILGWNYRTQCLPFGLYGDGLSNHSDGVMYMNSIVRQ